MAISCVTAFAQHTHSDDVTIRGNLAIGEFTTATETFGQNVLMFRGRLGTRFDDTSMSDFPNNDWGFLVNDAGSIAVGNENYLDSSGNLTVTGTVTTATQSLPDYVFEPDYELISLSVLAEFIKREKHLPNVPSDADVKQAGSINMNQMQLALLEKVEELTLYTIDQQRTIEGLRSRLQKQDEEFAERLKRLENPVSASAR